MKKKTARIKQTKHTNAEWIFQFWAWQLLFWALYRYFLRLPEWADEFIFKPLVFVIPVIWYVVKKEKASLSSIGLTGSHFFRNLLIGFGVSAIFIGEGVIVNIFKNGHVVLPPFALFMLILSLVTAFSEELLCRGFFFTRLLTQTKKAWYAIIVSTLMFMAFHIPILVTTLKFQGPTLILFFWTTLSLGIINSIFYLQTKSLVVPILVHLFWNLTVAILL